MSTHVASQRTYIAVFLTLMVLTAVTVGVAFVDLGRINDVVAMTIASIKALVVILFFMHVKDATKLTWLAALGGFIWLAILVGLTLSDYASRGWLGVPGK